MAYKLLKGVDLAKNIKKDIQTKISSFKKPLILAIIQVGNDQAAKLYAQRIDKMAVSIGVKTLNYYLDSSITNIELVDLIKTLNENKEITGIFLLMPLPSHINKLEVISAIDHKKDIDCISPINIGLMSTDSGIIFPSTPYAVMEILRSNNIEVARKECVIIGRSLVVGRPLATMMLSQNATVTICHSYTKDLKSKVLRGDIVVAALGKEKFITADMIKPGAVVIDVGININENGNICGDIDFENVKEIASYITPVPGGVGSVTVAILFKNLLSAYEAQENSQRVLS